MIDFNPRSPHGERRYRDATRTNERRFQSTLPARGATSAEVGRVNLRGISIHAPRTGSDMVGMSLGSAVRHFNPRSPHGERHFRPSSFFPLRDFNPRSPHGERPDPAPGTAPPEISIHAPRTGSDVTRLSTRGLIWQFQSTLPARGATIYTLVALGRVLFQSTLPARGATYSLSGQNRAIPISIHAPRTGSDSVAHVILV